MGLPIAMLKKGMAGIAAAKGKGKPAVDMKDPEDNPAMGGDAGVDEAQEADAPKAKKGSFPPKKGGFPFKKGKK